MRLLLCLALLLSATTAAAQEPLTLHFSGALTDLGDRPTQAQVTLRFRLYTAPEGGEALWEEVHADYRPIAGAIDVALGAQQALPSDVGADQRLYLGVQVDDDAEIAPRLAVGGALRALYADRAERATQADVALTADDATDVRGRDIHPASVSVGEQEVIDSEGRWVGQPVEVPATCSPTPRKRSSSCPSSPIVAWKLSSAFLYQVRS